MTPSEILAWLKEKNPISSDEAFNFLRRKATRREIRDVWKQYRNWKSVQSYEGHIAKTRDMASGLEPKMIAFDLEIAPMVVYTYEAYEANALKILQEKRLISFAWSVVGEPEIHCMTIADYPNFKPGIFNIDDSLITKDLFDIVESADILIGHNIRGFDIPYARTFFFRHGLHPTKKWTTRNTIDTYRISKKEFRFAKNSLEHVSEETGGEKKTDAKHSDLIWPFLDGDPKAIIGMKKYNKQDIKINKPVYEKLKGWDSLHPNLSFFTRNERACPTCQSEDIVEAEKFTPLRQGVRKNYFCKTCGATWKGEIIKDGYEKIKSYG